MQMEPCSTCRSFVPEGASACPGCGTTVRQPVSRRVLSGVLAMAGSSFFVATLTACYGAAYPEDRYDSGPPPGDGSTATCDDISLDLDGDEHCGDFDCNEDDAAIHTSATDIPGDGIDQDCSGADAAG